MKKYLAIIASILLISINIEVCNAADTSPGIATTVHLTDNKTSNLINDYNSAMDVLSFNDEKIISYNELTTKGEYHIFVSTTAAKDNFIYYYYENNKLSRIIVMTGDNQTAYCETSVLLLSLINNTDEVNSIMDAVKYSIENKKKSMYNSISIGKTFVLDTRYNTDKSKYYIGITAQVNQI